MMLQQVISQSNIGEFLYFNELHVGEELERTGFYGEVSPTTLFYNGKTFTTGITPYTVDNNQGFVFEIVGNLATYLKVGAGTTSPDIYNHPRPALHIDDSGFIWFLQVNPHHDPVKVFKSTLSGTISGGFDYQGFIAINFAYLLLFDFNDTELKIMTRSATDQYGQRIVTVDLENLAGATYYDVTNPEYATTDVRHYHTCLYKYGASDREWFVINHRDDNTNNIYKASLYYYLKATPNIIHNHSGDYSKDIASSPITETELDANGFAIQGSNADKSITNLAATPCQIANNVYAQQRVSENVWRIMRIDEELNKTYSATIPYKTDSNFMLMYFNGQEILMQVYSGTTLYIYSVSLNLSSVVLVREISNTGGLLDFPLNINTINSEYAAIIREDSVDYFKWINTNLFL